MAINKNREIGIGAFAKINILLDVTGRRSDGYHTIETIMQSIDLSDSLLFRVKDAPGDILAVEGDCAGGVGAGADNLVLRAVRLLRERYGRRFPVDAGLEIRLDKGIPSQAGLGGGSADAAATLLAVNRLFELALTDQELAVCALSLGADVPFCLRGGTMRAEGIGEILTPLSEMPECGIVVAKPRGGASTKAIYEAIDSAQTLHPDREAMERALAGGRDALSLLAKEIGGGGANVMQPVTVGLVPAVGKIVDALLDEGALAAQMSGSGSAVFGLFEDRSAAWDAMQKMHAQAGQLDLCDIFLTEPLNAEEVARHRSFTGRWEDQ